MIKSRRVLHVVSSLGMGGAETWLMELLRYQNTIKDPDFPKMDFLITFGKESVFDKEAKSLGSELVYLTLNKYTTLTFIKGFRRLLRTNNYIAIHDHQDYLSGWHFLFGLFLLPPVRIAHVHNPSYQIYNNYGTTLGRRIKIKLGSFLVKTLSTHIKGTSNQILEEYKLNSIKTRGNKPSALHCSFDLSKMRVSRDLTGLRQELKLDINDKVMLFLGRMDDSLEVNHPRNHKNSAFALHICEQLKDKDFKFLFVGANDYILDEFLNLAKSLNVINSIRVLGLRNDIPELMKISDLLLFPSRAEGLGMVAVEAQAAGLPVLVSNSVPQECVVIKELMHFYDLKYGTLKWANKVKEIMNLELPGIDLNDQRWVDSPFNIEVSIKELKRLYNNR